MATNNKINGIPAPLDSDVLDSADLRGIAQGVADNKTNISLLQTLLWKGSKTSGAASTADASQDVTLSESILNYRYLLIIGTSNAYGHGAQSLLLVNLSSAGLDGAHQGFGVSASATHRLFVSESTALSFSFPTGTTLRPFGGEYSAANRLTAVIGIK